MNFYGKKKIKKTHQFATFKPQKKISKTEKNKFCLYLHLKERCKIENKEIK